MKLGKFLVTQARAHDKKTLDALSHYIHHNVIILERIVIADTQGKQAVLMFGIAEQFDDIGDRPARIPEYDFEFNESLILTDGRVDCRPVRKI